MCGECMLGCLWPSYPCLHTWNDRRDYWRSKSARHTSYTWVWHTRY